MPTKSLPFKPPLFFVIGPLRTGSSLITRCLDDHPSLICLCESEINRALFGDYVVEHHAQRMVAHGFSLIEAIRLLDRKKQDDIGSLIQWYIDVLPGVCQLYGKPGPIALGDKSPDFARSPQIVRYMAASCPLIYTVRDPRAIFASIEVQDDATPADKVERWDLLAMNYLAWRPYLDEPNVLVVRYEDLVASPESTMRTVYSHLGLPDSTRFLEPFPRTYPERFLWPTTVDFATGLSRDFDATRLSSWKSKLTADHLDRIRRNPTIVEFMKRFDYD